MASAAAAGLGTRARYAFALAVLAATALLAVLNPLIAMFAVAGFALGWIIRNPRRFIAGVAAGLGLKYLTESPTRIAGGVGVLVAVAATGLTAWQVLLPGEDDGDPHPRIEEVVPVSYSGRATLETKSDRFALNERLIIPPDSLRLVRDEAAPELPEDYLARQLARSGWGEPRLLGEVLELSRVGRKSEAAQFGRMTTRATLSLPIPGDLSGGEAFLVATEATVRVIAPKHWVLATAPPSESETLPGDLEQRQVEDDDAVGEASMQVELAGPLYRNELGATLLGLSVAGSVKWGVLLVFGVLQDELKKLVAGIIGRLRRRESGGPKPKDRDAG